MTDSQTPLTPGEGRPAETACGARVIVTADTPFVHYQDEVVYFCGHDCKELYDEDPLNSCMAARLLSGK